MLDRLLLRNLLLYVAHYGFRFIFPLIATPFLAHVLTKEKFADFAIINSCIWTSTVFMEFGFHLYGVAKTGAAAEDRSALRAVVSGITSAKLVLAPLAIAVYLGLTAWTGTLEREPVAVFVGLISALGYGASFAWYFQGRQKGLTAVASEAGPQVVQFLLLLALVRSPSQLWLVFLLQAVPPLTGILVALRSILKDRLWERPSVVALRRTLKDASPFFVERFCYATYTSILPSLIALLATRSDVADYSVGERFGTLIAGVAGPIAQAVMPRVAKSVTDPSGGWRMSFAFVAFLCAVSMLLAGAVAVSADMIVRTFFSDDFSGAISVARIYCVTAVFSTLGYAFAAFVLIPRGQAKVMFWSGALALVFGMAAQFLLIPRLGADGAALGRMISEGTVAAVLIFAAIRLYRGRHGERARQVTSHESAEAL